MKKLIFLPEIYLNIHKINFNVNWTIKLPVQETYKAFLDRICDSLFLYMPWKKLKTECKKVSIEKKKKTLKIWNKIIKHECQ